MIPFFETELQGLGFVFLCGVGFALAVLFDGLGRLLPGKFRPLGDVLLFVFGAAAMLAALFVLRPGEMRLYHWAALLTGAILYLCGLRRLIIHLATLLKGAWSRRRKKEIL